MLEPAQASQEHILSGTRGNGSTSLDSDLAGTGIGTFRPGPGSASLHAHMASTGGDAGEDLEVDETGRLISAEKVIGTSVYHRGGDTLGTIHGLMIDKVAGRVAYAVMSFGGFLSIGERYHPLPWGTLT